MVRHTLKILQHLRLDFKSVSDHFGTWCMKGLTLPDKRIISKVAVVDDGTWQKKGHTFRIGIVFVFFYKNRNNRLCDKFAITLQYVWRMFLFVTALFRVFLVRIFPDFDWIRRFTISVFSPNAGEYEPKKPRTRTLSVGIFSIKSIPEKNTRKSLYLSKEPV